MTVQKTSSRLLVIAAMALAAASVSAQTTTATPKTGEASTLTQGQPNAAKPTGGMSRDSVKSDTAMGSSTANTGGNMAPNNSPNVGMASATDKSGSMSNNSGKASRKMKRKEGASAARSSGGEKQMGEVAK